jgi:hypothetical protein
MKNPNRISSVVCALAARAHALTEPWAIVGGASLFLQGGRHIPSDIDILCGHPGVAHFERLFASSIIKPARLRRSDTIISFFLILRVGDVAVEVMGDPTNKVRGNWIPNDIWRDSIRMIDFGGFKIPVSSLRYEMKLNRLIGNATRVDQIKQRLENLQAAT